MIRRTLRRATLCMATSLLFASIAHADLDEYVRKNDGAFAWTQRDKKVTPDGSLTFVTLTSQVWRGIPWNHQLQIFEPVEQKYPDSVLLFITGGSHTSRPNDEDIARGFALAKLCGARVAVLPQVPNQPLMDGKKEDDLIAETFVKYLESKDESWPLLFPMVKSAVRAMDAVQEMGTKDNKPVARFVVTGASKRGWTTWLSGAVDKRIVAIAPMVIPTLNMRAQNAHQLEVWGKYSEQIEDYTRRGLMEKIETPEGTKLWKMIDPFTYRDRITVPKLIINGTNDRYWTLDSLNLFWGDLHGPKWVVYLPNAGHGLEQNRHYALNGIGAFFRHVISKQPMPELAWKFINGSDDKTHLSITSNKKPRSTVFWVAKSETKDFREARWEPMKDAKLENGDGKSATVSYGISRPEKGFAALVGDLAFEIDGLEYHLSSEIQQVAAQPAK